MTVPSVFYLIQPQLQPKKSHGHGHGHDDESHGSEHDDEAEHKEGGSSEDKENEEEGSGDEAAEEQKTDENASAESEGVGGEGGSGGSESSATKVLTSPGDKGPDTEAHETEGGGNVEGVRFKGATSGGTKEGEQGDTRKHIPDAKGGSKKRIESDYAKTLGEATDPEQDPDDKDLVRERA